LPHYDFAGRIQPILFVGWTLGYILLFYALFALSLLFPAKWQNLSTVLMLCSIMALSQYVPNETYQLFYGDPILLEFAMGCLIGYVIFLPSVKAFVQRTPMWPFALVGIGGLIVAMQTDFKGYAEVALYASTGGILVFACAGQDLYRQPLKLGFLNHAASLSYGVYLIHPLVIPVFGAAIFSVIGSGAFGGALIILTVMITTTILAYGTYKIIEIPSNRYLRELFGVNAKARRQHV
jgi:exopolysaccharide production protein ExoZ